MKHRERYEAWSDSAFKAFLACDVEAQAALWVDGATRTAIDAFGDHHVASGRAEILESAEKWSEGMHNRRLLKNDLLSAEESRGIGNAVVRWTLSDGRECSCDFIYVISLDDDGRCVSYTEWNVVRAREA